VSQVVTGAVGAGLAAEQRPTGGTTVRRHSSVDITVAVESILVAIPDVTGLDIEQGTPDARRRWFVVERVDVFETSDEKARSFGSRLAAGTQWMTGRIVALGLRPVRRRNRRRGTGSDRHDAGRGHRDFSETSLLAQGLIADPGRRRRGVSDRADS
jgi:hypothetical protein